MDRLEKSTVKLLFTEIRLTSDESVQGRAISMSSKNDTIYQTVTCHRTSVLATVSIASYDLLSVGVTKKRSSENIYWSETE
jgi:hypothetical protein